jgi:hypothetical protein
MLSRSVSCPRHWKSQPRSPEFRYLRAWAGAACAGLELCAARCHLQIPIMQDALARKRRQRQATQAPLAWPALQNCSQGDKLYVFGGCGEAGRLNDLWEFDTSSNSWTQMPSSDAIKVKAGMLWGCLPACDCCAILSSRPLCMLMCPMCPMCILVSVCVVGCSAIPWASVTVMSGHTGQLQAWLPT